MVPIRLESAVRKLDLFLSNNETSMGGPCARDLASLEEVYSPEIQQDEAIIKRVAIDFKKRDVYESRCSF